MAARALLPLDGMLVIAFTTLWVQDPLSHYGGHWFVYNSWLVNFGSWGHQIPGWHSYGEPGAMVVEPILLIGGVYVYAFTLTMLLGTAVMRRAKARWPQMGKVGLLSITFATMVAFDIVFEGVIFLPLGIWEYPGGPLAVFPNTYHAFPLNEILTVSLLFTGVAALRFFRNDKGETLVERGAEQIRSPRQRTVLRLLAVIAGVHLIMFLTYNVPNYLIGTHPRDWPEDLVKRSYFTNGLCGEGTDRACPGPSVPLTRSYNSFRKHGSAYLGRDGQLVVPEGTKLPELVPFDRGPLGGAD